MIEASFMTELGRLRADTATNILTLALGTPAVSVGRGLDGVYRVKVGPHRDPLGSGRSARERPVRSHDHLSAWR